MKINSKYCVVYVLRIFKNHPLLDLLETFRKQREMSILTSNLKYDIIQSPLYYVKHLKRFIYLFCYLLERHLQTIQRYASVRYYTTKSTIISNPAVSNCKCDPKTGVCGKLDFCVTFRYALSKVTTDTTTNTLRMFFYSYNRYTTAGNIKKIRRSYTSPKYFYIPSGSTGDENKWKTYEREFQLECGTNFNVSQRILKNIIFDGHLFNEDTIL